MKNIFHSLAAAALLAAPAAAGYSATEAKCAAGDMQLFYYYLDRQPDPKVLERQTDCHPGKASLSMPGWLREAVPAMHDRKVWKDPEEGEVSAAEVWRAPVSILYEFADKLGKGKDRPDLESDLADQRLRFNMSVDRVARSGLETSFGGRGRALLSVLNQLMQDYDAVTQAAAQRNARALEDRSGDLLRRSRLLFSKLFETPEAAAKTPEVKYTPEARVLPGYRGVSLPVSGPQALFLEKGARVDMLVSFDAILADDKKEKVTATILQNVLVTNVRRPAAPGEPGVVQLLCNPNEAQYAALSLAQGSAIHLVRRAPGDLEMRPMEIASFRKLFK